MATKNKRSPKAFVVRTLVVAIACFFAGFGSGVMRASCLGNDPFSALSFAVSTISGLPISLTMPALNLVMFVAPLLLKRDQIGVGTICNMGICGFGANAAVSLITRLRSGVFPSYQGLEALPVRLGYFLLAMTFICVACGFYMGANVGVAPYDALAPIIEDRTNGRVPFRFARICTDALCSIAALLLLTPSGTQWEVVGLGTIFMAFGFGPIVDAFKRRVQPFYTWLDAKLN